VTNPIRVDPARMALVVVHQVGHVDRLPAAGSALPRVQRAVDDVRMRGGQVAWVRMGLEDRQFEAIPATSVLAGMVTPARRDELHANSAATRIHEALSPRSSDIIVRKIRVGAFSTTDLHQQLKARGITILVLAGISTSGAVLSTVREAMDLDYRVIVVGDGCADHDATAHTFLTGVLFPRHVTVIGAAHLRDLMPPPEPGRASAARGWTAPAP
jgi:nicotinamidase-related amidase